MDGESENPRSNDAFLIASSGKALSFGYFSLRRQRKVTRVSRESFFLSASNRAT